MSSVTAVHGWGLAGVPLDAAAASAGLPLWPAGSGGALAPADAQVLALLGGGGMDDAALWSAPFVAWIEVGSLSATEVGRLIRRASEVDCYLSLTSATANDLHLAAQVVATVARRHRLDGVRRDDIELAIHEAISNAVVHGNLEVDGMKAVSIVALDRFSADLARRIADPAFASRRIEVAVRFEEAGLSVEVADEGAGFTPADGREPGASGRGLDLIRSIASDCTLLDGGRRIRMRFAL